MEGEIQDLEKEKCWSDYHMQPPLISSSLKHTIFTKTLTTESLKEHQYAQKALS